MNRPELNGILETCLYVSDVAQSRDFYGKVFGFEPMFGDERVCALNMGPASVLILFKRGATANDIPIGGGFIPAHDGGGKQHFAFAIPEQAFKDWKSYLEGLDIKVESEVRWPQGGLSLYFYDPDGLVVELATPGVWKNY